MYTLRLKCPMSSLCRTRTCHLPNTLSRGMSRAGAHSQQACRMHPDMLYRAVPCRIIILNDRLSFLGSASPRLVVVSLAARRTEIAGDVALRSTLDEHMCQSRNTSHQEMLLRVARQVQKCPVAISSPTRLRLRQEHQSNSRRATMTRREVDMMR